MSERTSTNEQLTAVDHPVSGLSPSVRTIATDSIPPHDRSLAVSLCQIAGELGARPDDARQQTDRLLEPIANAVAVFEGYVRIRRDLVTSDRYDRPSTRDAAVLASDSLHATAYTMVADAPITDRRTLELYRILTEGSSTLATAFQTRSRTDAGPSLDDSPRPDAILAGIACTLGATAVGATGETRTTLERYGRSLLTALAAHPSATDGVHETAADEPHATATDGPHATAALLLSGRLGREGGPDENGESTRGDGESTLENDESIDRRPEQARDETTALEAHLERARAALTTLETSAGRSFTSDSPGRSPIARLERATRIPFEDVLPNDD